MSITKGTVVEISYDITTIPFPFAFFESDGGVEISSRLIHTVDATSKTITYTLLDDNADGVCAVCVATGDHEFEYGVKIIDLVEDPIHVLMYTVRHQNWSELDISYDWGSDDVPESLIKTSGEGSFYDSSLSDVRDIAICRQILDERDTWSDEIIKSICREFFLIHYQNNEGYECVKYLFDSSTPSVTITLDEIIGDIGPFIEPTAKDVYCEPVINYAYDQATEKYTKHLRVQNTDKSTYSSDYVSGFSGTDGEDVWDDCKALRDFVKQVEPIPESVSNLKWICTYAGALWYLQNLIQLMSWKRTPPFTIPYSVARTWTVGKLFYLNLPHQTQGVNTVCMVESIKKSKNNGTVTITAIIRG